MKFIFKNRFADNLKPQKEIHMAKFKIGDKVKVVKSNSHSSKDVGAVGVIVPKLTEGERGWRCNYTFDYLVDFGEKKSFTLWGKGETCRFYDDENLELVKEAPVHNWKVVILPNGETTKALYYENGKIVKTEEVKRYFKDKYSPISAVHAVVNKLFPTKLNDEKKPKVSFDWDGFIHSKFFVRFACEKDFKNFLKLCEKKGLKWNKGEKATEFGTWEKNKTLLHGNFGIPLFKMFGIREGLSEGTETEDFVEVPTVGKVPVIDYDPKGVN